MVGFIKALRMMPAVQFIGVEHVVQEVSAPYNLQTNGAAESAVRLVKGMLKALLLGLKRDIKARIPLNHPIVPWLHSHGAMLRTLLVTGEDGKIAHLRARGCDGPKRL